jgi:PST family polysaccharide transporter
LRKTLKNIIDFNLIKLSFFNSFSLVVKLLAGILSSKALAYFLGPSGLALLGVFREFLSMTINISSLGLQKGIVKYTAELKGHSEDLKTFVSTTMVIGAVSGVIIGVSLFFFSSTINNSLFPNNEFSLVIRMLAIIIPVSVFSNYFISIINGLGYASSIVKINILLYVLNTISIVLFSYYYGTIGAMVGVSVFYVLQLISIYIFKPKEIKTTIFRSSSVSNDFMKKLFGYTVMTIFSLFLFPFISILIRSEIINLLGEDAAGFWEAMKRISENYLFFATSLVMLSVLPKLSQKKEDFGKIVFNFYKSIIPVFIIGLSVLFFFKDFIIVLFYSKEFMPTSVLFKWYEIGDIFRILGIVLAANFYATRDIKGYIVTDIFLAIVMYTSTILLLRNYGLEGGAFGYCLSYVLYFILLLLFYRKKLFSRIKE